VPQLPANLGAKSERIKGGTQFLPRGAAIHIAGISTELVPERVRFLPHGRTAATSNGERCPRVYHDTRKPSCMFRPSSAVVIVATVEFEILFCGVPKFVWFKRLKISQRTSSRVRSTSNRLLNEKSTR
jgi:hypothetical protein